MRIYRIAPSQFLENYSGLGGSFEHGARWNLNGTPVLYFACSASTALLEMSQYLPSPSLIPNSYRLGVYRIDPTKVHSLPAEELPKDWAKFPYPSSTQKLGDTWLQQAQQLALRLPSAAVPNGLDDILLINPRHPDISNLKLEQTIKKLYPPRMFE